MKLSTTLSPRNSLVLVMDKLSGEIPASMGNESIASTSTCVAIGTLAEMDGETTITLTDSIDDVGLGDVVFDGKVETPGRELSVCNVENKPLLTMPVTSHAVRVRVFTNDANEPDRIVVLVDTA